jgi:aconitate hydratase
MINGIGIVGWGVGGIEAEAGMLGQPVYFLTPDVVGVHLTGALREGVTATDLALTVTQLLRKAKVVGKFVEFYGPGAAALAVVDRATIANMAPEYGATMGFFPIDAECVNYLRSDGPQRGALPALRELLSRAGPCSGFRKRATSPIRPMWNWTWHVVPSVAGPKRPQDRIELPKLKEEFVKRVFQAGHGKWLWQEAEDGGTGRCQMGRWIWRRGHIDHTYGRARDACRPANRKCARTIPRPMNRCRRRFRKSRRRSGTAVLIAAITSCTNTSNPSVMLAAGCWPKRRWKKG